MQIQKVPIEQFSWGIESENYVQDWFVDHDDTHETRSRVFPSYNGLLIYYRNMVKRHKEDGDFWLHSYPHRSHCSSISAHIHFKVKDMSSQEWKEYSYELYKRLYELIKLYQIFFKNSPNKEKKVLSFRHHSTSYCKLSRLQKDLFDRWGREYNALTPNGGVGTLEFRFNDVPKSLNQLALFYYLLNIAINPDIHIPIIPEIEINSIEAINKQINDGLFSYNDKESIDLYKARYVDLLMSFTHEVSNKIKKKFYDFYKSRYVTFENLINNMLEKDMQLFNDFFKNGGSEVKWSDELKSKFCKKIVVQLVKD